MMKPPSSQCPRRCRLQPWPGILRGGATAILCSAWLLLAPPNCSTARAAGEPDLAPAALAVAAAAARTDAKRLTAFALERNPRILAARQTIEHALAGQDELQGFFDPRLSARTGWQSDPVAGSDATFGLGGVEGAVMPGLYWNTGAEYNFFSSLPGDPQRIGETQLFAGVKVPLWRDRGFRLWELDRSKAGCQIQAARERLRAVAQEVRQEVEQRLVNWLEARSQVRISAAATRRVEKLLGDAEELVRLKTVPEYQIFPARMEVSLRRDEEEVARQTVISTRQRLSETVGFETWESVVPAWTPEALVAWGHTVTPPPPAASTTLSIYFPARGDWQELQYLIKEAGLELEKGRENLKSDVSIEARADWVGEDSGGGISNGIVDNTRNTGGIVALTWSRPWGYTAEKARIRQSRARISELRENLQTLELGIRTELQVTQGDCRLGQERLGRLSDAVTAARQTLIAEEESFRLGQGRSRNVLDAQKDLTESIRRQAAAAAELLRAAARYRYATGYSFPEPLPAPQPPAAAGGGTP